jgi:hypothetical protein
MPAARRLYCLILPMALAAVGCFGDPQPLPAPEDDARDQFTPEPPASRFDPAKAGTVRGRVGWRGPVPDVPPFQTVRLTPPAGFVWEPRPNPNAPEIDPATGALRGAVVFLRGVDPAEARPWDLPPVCVGQRDFGLQVVQGDAPQRVGFVRRGQAVGLVSRDPAFHALRARGAAFFTLAFPDPDQPLSRTLDKAGLVELSSAAGYFWMRAYLFVDDHSYYTLTDAAGRFVLPQVPPGRYELVAWHPSWRLTWHERDPESGLVVRQFFGPPITATRTVEVRAGEASEVAFTLAAE